MKKILVGLVILLNSLPVLAQPIEYIKADGTVSMKAPLVVNSGGAANMSISESTIDVPSVSPTTLTLDNSLGAFTLQCLGDETVSGTLGVTGVATFNNSITQNMVDNTANSLDVQQGTDNYINVSTTNGTENISFGNGATNPAYNFIGSGIVTVGNDVMPANTSTLETLISSATIADTTNTVYSGTSGNGGTVVVYPSDGLPVIAWIGDTAGTNYIYTVKCLNADCTSQNPRVQHVAGVGTYSPTRYQPAISGTVTADGFPFFVFSDRGVFPLAVKALHCTSTTCAASNVSSSLFGYAVAGVSVAAYSTWVGITMYYSDAGSGPYYILCNNPTAATPCSSVASTSAGVNEYSVVTVPSDGLPLIFNGWVARKCSNTACSATSATTTILPVVANHQYVAQGVSPATGFSALLYISSVSDTPASHLWLVTCGNLSCTSVTSTDLGLATWGSLVFRQNGLPVVGRVYTGISEIINCTTPSCSSSTTFTLPSTPTVVDTAMGISEVGNVMAYYGLNGSNQMLLTGLALGTPVAVGTDVGSSLVRAANGYFLGDVRAGSFISDQTGGHVVSTDYTTVGSKSTAPVGVTDGTIYYDTSTLSIKARLNGAWSDLSGGNRCSSVASPAACSSATAGSVVVAVGATSVVVNTTAVTANSTIIPTFDASTGAAGGCNTTVAVPSISARTAGTSFTLSIPAAPVTTQACYTYFLLN